MKRFIVAFALITLTLLASTEVRAAEKEDHDKPTHATTPKTTPKTTNETDLTLPPEIKDLLLREMRALYGGVATLAPALIVGEWEKVATTAKKIEGSYIMKQEITAEQKKELQKTLPPLFVEYDKTFHGYAGMLAHAAENKNAEVANFYLSKMTETCIKCHSRFAKERFPGLAELVRSESHAH